MTGLGARETLNAGHDQQLRAAAAVDRHADHECRVSLQRYNNQRAKLRGEAQNTGPVTVPGHSERDLHPKTTAEPAEHPAAGTAGLAAAPAASNEQSDGG